MLGDRRPEVGLVSLSSFSTTLLPDGGDKEEEHFSLMGVGGKKLIDEIIKSWMKNDEMISVRRRIEHRGIFKSNQRRHFFIVLLCLFVSFLLSLEEGNKEE